MDGVVGECCGKYYKEFQYFMALPFINDLPDAGSGFYLVGVDGRQVEAESGNPRGLLIADRVGTSTKVHALGIILESIILHFLFPDFV